MYQKTILIGTIGKIEASVTAIKQISVSNYSIVTTESTKNKETQEFEEVLEWHQCASFGHCADFANSNLKQGDLVQVEGVWSTRKWQDKDGNDQSFKELKIRDFPKKLPRYFTKNVNSEIKSSNGMQNNSSIEELAPHNPTDALGNTSGRPFTSQHN